MEEYSFLSVSRPVPPVVVLQVEGVEAAFFRKLSEGGCPFVVGVAVFGYTNEYTVVNSKGEGVDFHFNKGSPREC